jgi:hypothetical protein
MINPGLVFPLVSNKMAIEEGGFFGFFPSNFDNYVDIFVLLYYYYYISRLSFISDFIVEVSRKGTCVASNLCDLFRYRVNKRAGIAQSV